MNTIRRSNAFDKWLKKLKDRVGKAIILERISRLQEGNSGDVEPVGDGILEMRIHYGPGYRVYFKETGRRIIILLCGGNKSTQKKDIDIAKSIAKLYKE